MSILSKLQANFGESLKTGIIETVIESTRTKLVQAELEQFESIDVVKHDDGQYGKVAYRVYFNLPNGQYLSVSVKEAFLKRCLKNNEAENKWFFPTNQIESLDIVEVEYKGKEVNVGRKFQNIVWVEEDNEEM